MLHPSYSDLMKIVNNNSDSDEPIVNSRFSIVMATAKRARQIIAGEADVTPEQAAKPLSTAVEELRNGTLQILPEDAEDEELFPEGSDDFMISDEATPESGEGEEAADDSEEASEKAASEE